MRTALLVLTESVFEEKNFVFFERVHKMIQNQWLVSGLYVPKI